MCKINLLIPPISPKCSGKLLEFFIKKRPGKIIRGKLEEFSENFDLEKICLRKKNGNTGGKTLEVPGIQIP
jgi:hypothetical protein